MGEHGYFAHNSQDGRSPFDRMRAAGYSGGLMGENIAAGQPTPAAVMDAWMHSAGHRANILNRRFRAVGLVIAPKDPFGKMSKAGLYTLDFGSGV